MLPESSKAAPSGLTCPFTLASISQPMQSNVATSLTWNYVIGGLILPIFAFSFLLNIALLVPPLYMLQVYDRVLPSDSRDTLSYLSLIAIAALLFMAVTEIIRSLVCQRAAAKLDRSLGAAAFSASLTGPRAVMGDIQPLRDLATVRSFVASRGLANIFDIPFVPLFLLVLFLVHWILFLLTVAGATILVLIVIANQISNRTANIAALEQATLANLTAQAFVKAADTLKAMGMKSNAIEAWGARFAEAANQADLVAERNAYFASLSRSLRMMLQLAILGVGAYLVLEQEITAGMIFASSIISGRALQPIDQLIGGWKQTADAHRALERLSQTTSAFRSGMNKVELPTPRGVVYTRELVWLPANRPRGTSPVIRQLTFGVEAGEMLAIIGPSGAGKSTLVRLLAGALEPSGGLVTLDGADYRTWDEQQLGRHIGYLSQDVQLLPGTVAQNIARFDPDATNEGIIAAAQRAQVHELIMSLPDGYQTMIEGSGASGISGGTRQRIGLARAFFGDPRVLLLDEPNANLDADGDVALERALVGARQSGTTIVLVTHRLSIACRCDRVLLLRNGEIESIGPAAETIKQLRQAQVRKASDQRLSPDRAGRKVTSLSSADIGKMRKNDHE